MNPNQTLGDALPRGFKADCGHWLPEGWPPVAERERADGSAPVFLCTPCADAFIWALRSRPPSPHQERA